MCFVCRYIVFKVSVCILCNICWYFSVYTVSGHVPPRSKEPQLCHALSAVTVRHIVCCTWSIVHYKQQHRSHNAAVHGPHNISGMGPHLHIYFMGIQKILSHVVSMFMAYFSLKKTVICETWHQSSRSPDIIFGKLQTCANSREIPMYSNNCYSCFWLIFKILHF